MSELNQPPPIGMWGDEHLGVKHCNIKFNSVLCSQLIASIYEMADAGVKELVSLGDMFDSGWSLPTYLIDWSLTELPTALAETGIHLHVLEGNHDQLNLNDSHHTPLNIWKNQPDITIYKDPTETHIGGRKVLILPWIHAGNEKVSMNLLETTDAGVVFGHFELNGFYMYSGGHITDKGLDTTILKRFDAVYSGHFHHPSSHDDIHNIGSFAVITRADVPDADKKGWWGAELTGNTRPLLHPMDNNLHRVAHYVDGMEIPLAGEYDSTDVTLIVDQAPTSDNHFNLVVKNLSLGAITVNIEENYHLDIEGMKQEASKQESERVDGVSFPVFLHEEVRDKSELGQSTADYVSDTFDRIIGG